MFQLQTAKRFLLILTRALHCAASSTSLPSSWIPQLALGEIIFILSTHFPPGAHAHAHAQVQH